MNNYQGIEEKGVFDGFVDIDSRLHIDLGLIKRTGIKEFENSNEEFHEYFNNVLALIKGAKKTKWCTLELSQEKTTI